MTALTLYQIESDLQQLAELREQAELEGDSEALKVIDQQLADYLTKEAAKIDSYAGLLHQLEDAECSCRAEATRLKERADALKDRREAIKNAALRAMQAHGVTKLWTPQNTLRVQGNGGLTPLEIAAEQVPDQYRTFRVSFSYGMWLSLLAVVEPRLKDQLYEKVESSPNHGAIREALKRGESVPGARLGERGSHLRVD